MIKEKNNSFFYKGDQSSITLLKKSETKKKKWEVVIGLEIHAQIYSKTKLFSESSTKFASKPNSQVSFFDAGMPGMLPVINKFCIEQAVKTGLGIGSNINLNSYFDRKNYFYADLPSGYQITQFKKPIITGGNININLKNGKQKNIRLERIHIEQDAGKSIHDIKTKKTYIDLNRAGIGLMEIVTKPEINSSEETTIFMRKIRSLMRYLQTCDGNMEKGNIRADINISLRLPEKKLGTRVEIKNLNSIKFMVLAIEHEIKRQTKILEAGKKIIQETRLFDKEENITKPMRLKENSHDYRYFPDPDLPTLILEKEWIENLNKNLPELPDDKEKRFIKNYNLNKNTASILTEKEELANFFEKAVLKSKTIKKNYFKTTKMIANWCISELFFLLNKEKLDISKSKISAENLSEIVDCIQNEIISGPIAKKVFLYMWKTGNSAKYIIKQNNLQQISTNDDIQKVINLVINESRQQVIDYKSGNNRIFSYFIGQVMKHMKGKCNPKIVHKLLKKKLH